MMNRWLAVLAGLLGVGCASDHGTPSSGGGVAGTAAEYVAAHNAVRAAVEQPPNYPAGQTWEPLPPVTWSDPIASTAQGWAEHLAGSGCTLEHASGSGYGENLAMGTHLTAQGAVELWAEERASYSYDPSYRSAAGHYTQIVWRKSTQIGCGSAACSGGQVIVCCRYSPPGNVIGQQPY